ncbi:MAG: polyribonucleotide nucleotidyltransferase [Candidatus Melainabacteria bacterium]
MTDYSGAAGLYDVQTKTFKLGDQEISIETGRLARQAGGSVLLKCGETVMMVVATGSAEPRAGIDFFPLLCDYEEKMFSVGRLPGGYLKREGRPSEKATLVSRLIDRPIRPLWPEGYRNDVQIVAQPMSVDNITQPDVLAIFGASMALELSGLPFEGPVGAVRVGRLEGKLVVNPTFQQSEESDLDLVVAGTADSIMMVEAGCTFIPEADMLEALAFAHQHIQTQVQVQNEFRAQCGIEKKAFVPDIDVTPVETFVNNLLKADVEKAYHEFDRDQRKDLLKAAKEKLKAAVEALPEDDAVMKIKAASALDHVGMAFKNLEKKVMRAMVTSEGVRADGRKSDEIRPIFCEVGVLPRAHGSALFTRGTTQVLSVATLGAPGDVQRLDGVDPATEKRWMHHYSFPAFSVGEVRPLRGPGRREIGHGALAERANAAALPPKDKFGYTLRVNSEVLSSNGSTSMASTCGASLALMDAGVPVSSPIGGIAMGLIKEGDQFVVLSDIQGVEDFLGDMDFKVTGNEQGITALQMDIKIRGISLEIMKLALEQARVGRLHIIGKMAQALSEPRQELSPYAPRIISFHINKEDIGTVIGPGGKMIRSIIEETGVSIDIEEDGLVIITSFEGGDAPRAREIIEKLTMRVERGQVMMGKVVRIIPIGAFVELAPGKDGMVHISQLSHNRVATVEEAVKPGEMVCVKVQEIDDRGRINLTIKGVSDEERAKHGLEPLPKREQQPPREDREPAAR